MPKDAQEGGGPALLGTEGRQGSAGSNEGGSKDLSSGEAETASEPQPPSVQQQVPVSAALDQSFLQGKAVPQGAIVSWHHL